MNDVPKSIVHLISMGWKIKGDSLISPPMDYDEFVFLEWMSKP